jgi:hypothetical protein
LLLPHGERSVGLLNPPVILYSNLLLPHFFLACLRRCVDASGFLNSLSLVPRRVAIFPPLPASNGLLLSHCSPLFNWVCIEFLS